eukprot:TRINITY_DN13594_c0_g1_i5.p2 TRINITY_DN13594_c0_g1~~TRINITY_DN13594_c0_g1_i5.p2  ORF type:complete len:317 (-),score=60.49 TRINITY_DN13594_c0_g1_i5:1279-2229(-)
MKDKFRYVYIPQDQDKQIEELEMPIPEGKEVECLLDNLKLHFAAGPKKTEAQTKAQISELKKKMQAGSKMADQLLEMAASMQAVESVNLLSNTPANKFVGVNMYVDDEGLIKGLPLNPRATSLAQTCGLLIKVYGDAFIARFMDSDAEFERLDFTLKDVDSNAEWVKLAKKQQEKRSQGDSGLQVLQSMGQQQKLSAEDYKDKGNDYFKKGQYSMAIIQYTKALEQDGNLIAALNNRAMANLKMAEYEEAMEDCNLVLQKEPQNVKALFRRGCAKQALGDKDAARQDFQTVLSIQNNNEEAKKKLEELEEPDVKMI